MKISIAKAWAAWNKMDVIWKSHLPDNLNRRFFRATVEAVLMNDAIACALTKSLQSKLHGTYTQMLSPGDNIQINHSFNGSIPVIFTVLGERIILFA